MRLTTIKTKLFLNKINLKVDSQLFTTLFMLFAVYSYGQTTVNFAQENAVQNFTVPAGVTTMTITAVGAMGGASGNDTYAAGYGATIKGVCTVIPGHVISVVVGQEGFESNDENTGGGGGGTFVFDSNTGSILVIAGGGGGEGYSNNANGANGGNGGIVYASPYTTTSGYDGASSGYSGAGGTTGHGGARGVYTNGTAAGAGGGGWLSNGDSVGGGASGYSCGGGQDRTNHFAGGAPLGFGPDVNAGGYGGGGGGGYVSGGGGGGYNGGGGGNDPAGITQGAGGGGGGSYLNGTIVGTPTATNAGNGSAQLVYTVSALLTTTASTTANVSCYNLSDGNASASPSGGTTPYTYSWSNGTSTVSTSNPTGTILKSGSYTVTVTDHASATATAAVTITQPASALSATASVTANAACNGNNGTAQISASGGTTPYTYSWSNSATTSGISATAGTYTVTVQDNHGCSATGSVTITQPAAVTPVITSGNGTTFCSGGSTTLGTQYSGNDALQFSGSSQYCTIADAADLDFGTSTDFTVEGWIYCSASESNYCGLFVKGGTGASWNGFQLVLVNNEIAAEINNGSSLLGVGNGLIGTTALNDGNWHHVAMTVKRSSTTAVLYVDGVAQATVTNSIVGGNLTFNGLAYMGVERGNSIYFNGKEDEFRVWNFAKTQAQIQASMHMAVAKNAANLVAYYRMDDGTGTTATDLTGNGNSATLVNSPTWVASSAPVGQYATYSWSNSATTYTTTASSTGTYSVSVTDVNGCTGTANISLTVNTVIPNATVTANVLCSGNSNGSAQAAPSGGTAPYTYAWQGGATTSSISAKSAGTYTLTVHDNIGCSGTASVTITQPSALAANASVTANAACNGNNGTAQSAPTGGSSPYTYSWSNSASSSSITATAGTYTLTVHDNNGCSATGSVTITQPAAIAPVISSTGGNTFCSGGSTTLSTQYSTGTNYGLQFNGSNSYGTIPEAADLDFGTSTDYTVQGWINFTTNETSFVGLCVKAQIGGGYPYWQLAIYQNYLVGEINSSGPDVFSGTSGPALNDGNWHNVAMTVTRSTNTMVLYVDGVAINTIVNTQLSANVTSTGPVYLGVERGKSNFYSGKEDEFRIFDQALSQAQITANMNTTIPANTTGLVAYYRMDEGSGSTTTDLTGNGNTCTLVNSPTWITSTAPISGYGAYTYSWSNSSTTSSISASSSNTYSVTVSLGGCSGTASTTINVTTIAANATVIANVLCNGGTGTAQSVPSGGSVPYTYSWSNSATTSNITATAGTYTLTVHDNSGCSGTASVTITQPSALAANASVTANAACNGSNGTAQSAPTGGSSPYTYLWSNSASSSSITATAGTYTLMVHDNNGCSSTGSVTITQPGALAANTSVTANVICNGGNGTAQSAPSGGVSPYTYSWSNSATTSSITATAGTYTLTVQDNNGCNATGSATITQPGALAANASVTANVICNGGTGTAQSVPSGGSVPYTYSWSNSATTSSITATAGTYTLTVQDNSGCSGTASVTITQPSVLAANASVTANAACNGNNGTAQSAATGGSSPYTYLWSNSASSSSITATAGTYTLMVTDNNGCSSTGSVTITQPAVITPVISSSEGNTFCSGGSTTLSTQYSSTNDGLQFSGASQYCSAPEAPDFDFGSSTDFTIEGWIKCNGSQSDWTGICSKAMIGGGYPGMWQLNIVSHQLTAQVYTSTGGFTFAGTSTVDDGNWHHIAMTLSRAATTAVLYVDGVAQSTVNNSAVGGNINSTGPLVLGAARGAVLFFNGEEDEFRIWNIAKTQTQIQSSMNTTVSANSPNLVAYYRMDDGSGSTISDVTGNGNDGTLINSPSWITSTAPISGYSVYTYSWSNSSTTSSISASSSNTYSVTVSLGGCSGTASTTINVTTIAANATVTANVLCNGGTGTAQSTPTGGSVPYTYSWSNSATTSSITATAGTYTLTVQDNSGCSGTASVTITQPSALAANASVTANAACNGSNGTAQSAPIGGSSPYTYLWSNSASSSSITATAGTYTLMVTDNNGCSATASVTITQAPSVTASATLISNSIACSNTGSASVTPGGGDAPYTYLWSDASSQATATASNLSGGSYTVTVTDNNGCSATASVTITQAPGVAANVSSTNVLCFGGTGSAQASPTGGTSPYTYQWSDANTTTTASVSNLTAGSYSVLVTDNNGCTATASVTITAPATAVSVSIISETNPGCFGTNGSATASGSGGTGTISYSWNDANSTMGATLSAGAGSYTVTATDLNGCSATASVSITQPVRFIYISAGTVNNVSCNGGSNGSVTVTPVGGNSPYTYVWSNGSTTVSTVQTAVGLSAGTYTITVMDNCGVTYTATAAIAQPNALRDSVTATTNITCGGGNGGSVSLGCKGGTYPYMYLWSNGSTLQTASGLSAGTYSVVITDQNGCTNTVTGISVTQPNPLVETLASVSYPMCNGSKGSATVNVTGGSTPYGYIWTSAVSTTATATGLAAGTYTVSIKDAHRCTATLAIVITQPGVIRDTMVAAAKVNVSCNGGSNGSATVGVKYGTSPYTYNWTPNVGSTATVSGLSAGVYSVMITDNNGCSSSTSMITITQPSAPLNDSVSVLVNVGCYGGAGGQISVGTRGGTAPYTYAWSNGKTTYTMSGLSAGTYTTTITDKHGCSNTLSVTITQPTEIMPVINTTCIGNSMGTVTISATGGASPYTYKWSNAKTTTSMNVSNGTYTVTVKDAHGCSETGSVTVNCPAPPQAPGKEGDEPTPPPVCCQTLNDVNLYPNPNNGQFTITGLDQGMLVEVYDYTGRRISTMTAADTKMQLNIAEQPNGIYLVRIMDKTGTMIAQKKVVKTQ